MEPNNSPWLYRLNRTRPVNTVQSNMTSDVVIVGGGISGLVSAYYILKNTEHSLILIEATKVAHGATGHNAGQLVGEFERPFTDLVREYGLEKAIDAENNMTRAWILLDEMIADAKLATPISTFLGYNGYKYAPSIIDQIKANSLRRQAGEPTHQIYVAKESPVLKLIPHEFAGLYDVVPQSNILDLLETEDESYVAASVIRKGCANSARLTEELAGYLLATYPKRFQLFEHSPVKSLDLHDKSARVSIKDEPYHIDTKHVLLCTNGFEWIDIKNHAGANIDKSFHEMVNGDIGYMAAYTEELGMPPTALGYYDQSGVDREVVGDAYHEPPYFYKTRRPYELEKNQTHSLICIGGPEEQIEETRNYDRYAPFLKEKGELIDDFVHKTIAHHREKKMEYKFEWHGIMCYTPTNMRVVGFEPKNPILLYNLGCNGVGIIPSIYGSFKISKLLSGETFPPSIFDPRG